MSMLQKVVPRQNQEKYDPREVNIEIYFHLSRKG